MPHYFFDVHDGAIVRDDEGVDYESPDIARREAMKASGAMLVDHADTWTGETWKMVVRDEHGVVIYTMTFSAS